MIMEGCSALNPRQASLASRPLAFLFIVLVGSLAVLSAEGHEGLSSNVDSGSSSGLPSLEDGQEDHKRFYKKPDENDHVRKTCKVESGSGGTGGRSDDACPGKPRLVRLAGEQVGHVEELELVPGKTHLLKTINMKPVIFEIPNFFTSEECSHIISLAKEQGLHDSATKSTGNGKGLALRDVNGDQKLSLRELQLTLEDGYDVFLDDDDIRQMYSEIGIDLNSDGFLSRQEVNGKTIGKISTYITKLLEEQPIKKSRFSEQTWIYPDQTEDPLVQSFQDRISKLTQLPQALIDKFSYFQVVHYGKHGHYNAHHDSSFIDESTCCHLTEDKHCRICRFMTIMVYLNDVEEGGETAFPVANNETYNTHVFRQTGMMNLNSRCGDSNLKVHPQQGKAVVWYNHFINNSTGWLGDVDPFTWHGGCPVTKGQKWIMNRWISVSESPDVDLAVALP
ncbi:transmembrane prolyl 4-hydroxylase-like [Patiria miniata]|uniref:Fe2OG dioxygenase domain-containing protein n=1 Tax=Patiria miniata TaxID=46514 RepID=A0A913Z9M2_PATMI|nr:transmembrane prolyl 4-hydroxylase-like [Patiria miniata]